MAWLDTGTIENMNKASQFVGAVQSQQGMFIACLEEIAYYNKFIGLNQLYELGKKMETTEYGKYILNIYEKERKKIQ